jgi:hypothetical protein
MGMNIYSLLDYYYFNWKKNRKTNFNFWNFKDRKNGKIGGKQRNILDKKKERNKIILLELKKTKKWEYKAKRTKKILILEKKTKRKEKKTMKGKQELEFFFFN